MVETRGVLRVSMDWMGDMVEKGQLYGVQITMSMSKDEQYGGPYYEGEGGKYMQRSTSPAAVQPPVAACTM
jgi:hypothetical protein